MASGLLIVWGVCLGLSVVCTSYKGFYVQRFFLGFLESGIGPMFMLIVVSALNLTFYADTKANSTQGGVVQKEGTIIKDGVCD